MNLQSLLRKKKFLVGFLTIGTSAIVTLSYINFKILRSSPNSSSLHNLPSIPKKVMALGRIEPSTGIVSVFPAETLSGDRVSALFVKEGDLVVSGKLIAILSSYKHLQNLVRESESRVRLLRLKLLQVKAGAKNGEIVAQKYEIERLQTELQNTNSEQSANIDIFLSQRKNAQKELYRFDQLYRKGAVSESFIDQKRLDLQTSTTRLQQAVASQRRTEGNLNGQLNAAKATLSQITEVRPIDIDVAQSELEGSISNLRAVETQLQQAYVYSPISGKVLKTHSRPGEKIGLNGIIDLGQTKDMVVIAEVYQSDIRKVVVGQNVVTTSQGFPGELTGQVEKIGQQVARQSISTSQPGETLDRRIIEVRIRLDTDNSKKVNSLTNLQVKVAIMLQNNS